MQDAEKEDFTRSLIDLLGNVSKLSDNAQIRIRTNDGSVVVYDAGKILYAADTLAEFTWKFLPGE